MSNINQYTFLQHNIKDKFKNDKQVKNEQKNHKGVVKINPTNLNNYQQILRNEQNSYRNYDYETNRLNQNNINKVNNFQNNNQMTRMNNIQQQINKEKKDNQLKATLMKLRANEDRGVNIYNQINIRQDRSADRVKDPPRDIITADMGKKRGDLNRSVNLKSTRTGQMYSAQNRNNLILNNLYGENYKEKNYNQQQQLLNPTQQNLINKNLNTNINQNINPNVKNNSIFNHDNLNNFMAKNHNNVYTPLNNNNIRKNKNNNIPQNQNQKNGNDSNRLFSPVNNRNITTGISANNNRNFSTIANKTQKKPINTASNNNSLETINGYNNIATNNLNTNRIYSSNIPNNNPKGNSIKQLFQSNYDTVNIVNTPINKNRNKENNIRLTSSDKSNRGAYKENFENYNNLQNLQTNNYNSNDIKNNLTFLSGPEKKIFNIIEDNSNELSKNEGTKNICNLNGKSVREYSYREDRNFTYRHAMEDYSRIIDRYMNESTKGIFCLFDGHGGSEPVKYARDRLPDILQKFLGETKNNVEKSLISCFQKLDEELKNNMECENSGSTACVIYIYKDSDIITGGRKTFYCANVGDTRCLLISTNGYKRMSFDHKCTDEGEVARIRKVGGVVFNGRVFGQLALSRALGDHAMKKYGVTATPYINKHIVSDKDKYIILCSDGVWDVCDDEEVYKMSFKIKNADEYSALVINTSLERGSRDNISCIVIKIN